MDYSIKKAVLTFSTDIYFWQRDAEKLRGFFTKLYTDESLFHNHGKEKEYIYRMPLIQYKVIEGKLVVVGINEGAELVKNEFLKHKVLPIGDDQIVEFETQLDLKLEELKVTDELYSYRFETPWLPINQKNISDYRKGKLDLDRVLTNNILTIFKGIKIEADKKIMVKGEYEERKIEMKDIIVIGFVGNFVSNVKIPDFLGIGNRGSSGFGCVVKKIERRHK